MDVLTLKQMIIHEAEAFRSGVTDAALMEAAGEAMALSIITIYPHAHEFLILIGKGNNGGDGLVVARYLTENDRRVRVILTLPEEQLGELPRIQLKQLRTSFPHVTIAAWNEYADFPDSDGVVIDALLGMQARGPLRGVLAEVVAKLNAARVANFFRTVALDYPSGLAAYDEEIAPSHRDVAVVADVTLAVGFPKNVLIREALSAWVGRLEIVPWGRTSHRPTSRQVLVGHELANLLPRRSALAHKNDFGRLAIVAGSIGFTGAPILCAQAGQATGAGLISIVTQSDVNWVIAAQAPPEAMVSGWPTTAETPPVIQNASAIAIGPGLGIEAHTVEMLLAVLAVGCPVLIDADGLSALALNLDLLSAAKGPVLLTPHPGEMARLIGRKFETDEREAVARAFVDQHHVTLVLKGTRTLVTAPGQPSFINTTGNPGLSTGGSGDTLSGIIAALLAQGLAPLEAARLGVWLHGHAADLALAERECEEGLTPTMVCSYLGEALVSLRAQATAPVGLIERAKSFHQTQF